MFQNLTQRLSQAIERMRGRARLSEEHVREGLREVRIALLEADVALPVVTAFLDKVRERALGSEVLESLSPAQTLVKIVHQELVSLMGESAAPLDLNHAPPVVILLAGLQGAGKTTTAGKLAKHLQERARKRVMLVSCDIYRPAAIEQLKTVAEQVGAMFAPSTGEEKPADIARRAVDQAKRQLADVLIVDTAGRLHVDQAMMDEVAALHEQLKPRETLFVVDSMTGQDAANSAKAFADVLPLTGVVLTKTDGDARGGAALSVRHITGKPIKFLGVGEKSEALEAFHPDRVASRILGMGDVLSLIEKASGQIDVEESIALQKKMRKNEFTFQDFLSQLKMIRKMGSMTSLMSMIPGMGKMMKQVNEEDAERELKRIEAIILSMTTLEREKPGVIDGSRRKRIAAGSGTSVQQVNQLLKQFAEMRKMMKKFSKMGAGGIGKLLGGRGLGDISNLLKG